MSSSAVRRQKGWRVPSPNEIEAARKKLRDAEKKLRAQRRQLDAAAGAGTYELKREEMAAASREQSHVGREIGPTPNIADPDRRELCRDDLELFCVTYIPTAFSMAWGEVQRRSVRRIEATAKVGGLHAFAEARGSGKTARCRAAALWAVAYGHRHYSFIVGSTAPKAEDSLDSLKLWMRFLPLFVADFPEIAHAAIKIGGIAQRAGGQLCQGQPTLIEWGSTRVILPTVPPPANWPAHWPLRSDGMVPTSGSIIGASGLTGEGIRGALITTSTGELIRPDFVLLDDPQTRESAGSVKQTTDRMKLIVGDLLGLAGPGEEIACVCPCTVIEPEDLADQILDRERYPLWRGERSGILTELPKNLDAWEPYFELYHEAKQQDEPDLAECNAYFLEHEKVLTDGSAATWPARKDESEVSPVQHAMHLYIRGKAAFMAEYMNAPIRHDVGGQIRSINPETVAARVKGTERYVVPVECSMITVFFDPGAWLHWYSVVAWNSHFGGTIIDYGCWPRQSRLSFDSHEAQQLRQKYPDHTDAQLVRVGLDALTPEVLGRQYVNQSGGEVQVTKAMVDTGFERDAVYDFCRASPFRPILLPSKGVGRSKERSGVGNWKHRDGERRGHHWRQTAADVGRGIQIQYDTDVWKTIIHERLTIPLGGRSTLTLYGGPERAAIIHETFGRHMAAEYGKPGHLHGSDFIGWVRRPNVTDNHWFDTLAGCAVGASVAGLKLPTGDESSPPVPSRTKRKQVSFADLIEQQANAARNFAAR